MELNEVLQARKILADHIDDKVGATLAYKLMKFLKASDNEEEFYYTKLQEIISEYAMKDADGAPVIEDGNVKILPSKVKDCHDAMTDLCKISVAEPGITFDLKELSELRLSAKEMYSLDSFITT